MHSSIALLVGLLALIFGPAVLVAQPPRSNQNFDPPLSTRARDIIRDNPLAESLGFFRLIALQRNIFIRDACDLRLCFSLDGSNSITADDFDLQRQIVNIIAAVTNVNGATSSAVQYGIVNDVISARTDNITEFRMRVNDADFQKSDGAFIGAGLGFCISDVQMVEPRNARRVILLGNGRGEFADTFIEQVLSAVNRGEQLFAIGVGRNQDVPALVQAVGGRRSNVYSIRGDTTAEEVVVSLIRRICRLDD